MKYEYGGWGVESGICGNLGMCEVNCEYSIIDIGV